MRFLLYVIVGVTVMTSAARADGIVSFTVDNINKVFLERAVPLFEKYGLRGTLYAQTGPVGVEEWDMSWDDIRTMRDKGWEIGAHSYSHMVHLSKADPPMLDLELGAPAARIFRETGIYPQTFATPFGDFDERVLKNIRHYYDAHLMAWGNDGRNSMTGVDPFRVHRTEILYTDTSAAVCEKMERAVEDKMWLVFMIHQVVDKDPVEYQITYQMLDEVLACAAKLQTGGLLEVLTAAEALERIPHLPSQ